MLALYASGSTSCWMEKSPAIVNEPDMLHNCRLKFEPCHCCFGEIFNVSFVEIWHKVYGHISVAAILFLLRVFFCACCVWGCIAVCRLCLIIHRSQQGQPICAVHGIQSRPHAELRLQGVLQHQHAWSLWRCLLWARQCSRTDHEGGDWRRHCKQHGHVFHKVLVDEKMISLFCHGEASCREKTCQSLTGSRWCYSNCIFE